MQGAFNIKTKRQLEICKWLPLKLDFEAKFKEARVACPTPCKYMWHFWQRLTKALLSCWVRPTVSYPRALVQPKAPSQQAACGIGTSISCSWPNQHCKHREAPAKPLQEEGAVQSMFAQCAKLKSSFLQSQLTSRAGMCRAHLQHLCPIRSWIAGGNHKPSDAG